MTEIYKTPDVLHIVESDIDGNKRTVRYIREDHLAGLMTNIRCLVEKMIRDFDLAPNKDRAE